jgi:hypothetical protein
MEHLLKKEKETKKEHLLKMPLSWTLPIQTL